MDTRLLWLIGIVFIIANIKIANAQQGFWQPIAEEVIETNNTRNIFPGRYATYQLQAEAFQAMLKQAPLETETRLQDSEFVLTLPNPDGGEVSFRIVAYKMMEDALSEAYPEISNYYGVDIRNPERLIRLDWTYRGFHALVIGSGATYAIDPYQWEDHTHYQVYYKKDYAVPAGNTFECGVRGTEGAADWDHRMAGDCTFRTYRLAMATTGEYSNFHGASSPAESMMVMSAVNTAMNRVNGIYERDLALRMILIGNTDDVFYYDGGTDPYTNDDGAAMLSENQTNLDLVIGTLNYDIGHVFSTGGGGIASLNSPCSSTRKARGVTGLPSPVNDIFYVDYVSHEMGHQFGANHTQNNPCNRNNSTAMEPGSASTIMGYAGICAPNVQNNSDDYFHAISIQEMMDNITGGTSSTCDSEEATSNNAPAVNVPVSAYSIPNGTPFVLSAESTDADGTGSHTFCWEQFDNEAAPMPPNSTNTGGPAFRTFDPAPAPSRYFPALASVPAGSTWEVLPTVARDMAFRVTVRDNAIPEGCTDETDVTLTVDGTAGPFDVLTPGPGASWTGNQSESITWDVAGTDQSPVNCSAVDILLSTDGGATYSTVLAEGVANTGTASVTAPDINTTSARIMVRSADNVFFDINGGDFEIAVSAGPDCAQEALFVDDSPIPSGTYATTDTIFSIGSVFRNSQVVFQAGEAIFLEPGFHARAGSDFRAFIDDCSVASLVQDDSSRNVGEGGEATTVNEMVVNPQKLNLSIAPNPARNEAVIQYTLSEDRFTQLLLFDMLGRARVLQPLAFRPAGLQEYQLNSTALSSGIYFIRLKADEATMTQKLQIIRD